MLAKCSMAGKDEEYQYRSQYLPRIPVVNAITVVILTKIKMLFKILFTQLLLLCVQSSTAEEDPIEIFVQPVKPAHDVWITKSMHSEEEGVPDLDFLKGHHIPGLYANKTKNIYVEDFNMEKHIIDSRDKTSPYFGMLPLFISVTGEQYETVGLHNKVFLPADGTIRLACVTHGIHKFTTSWMDGEGFNSHSATNPNHDGKSHYHTEVLPIHVHDVRLSTSFGCELRSADYGISLTKWFNFTVKPDVKLSTDNNTCGQVTFTCLDSKSQPEEVTWIVNENDEIIGTNKLTVLSNDPVVRRVECIIGNPNLLGKAHIDFNDSPIADCPVEANEEEEVEDIPEESPISDDVSEDESSSKNLIIRLAITGIVTTLLIVIAYIIKRRHSMKRTPFMVRV